MKRCPECRFLYEDEQNHCEMDGTRLMYTANLPSLPGTFAKSIWDKWTVALLVLVIAGTMLVILYRAMPRVLSSSSRVHSPVPNQSPLRSNELQMVSETPSPQSASEDPSSSVDEAGAASAPDANRPRKGRRTSSLRNVEPPAPAPAVHVQPPLNAKVPNAAVANAPASKPVISNQANQKPAATTYSITAHPKPPESVAKPTPPKSEGSSGLKSILKKAGRVLKKPFGN